MYGCPCFVHPKSTLLHLKGTLLHHGDPFDAFRRLLTPSRALFGESTDLCSTTLIHFSLAQPLAAPCSTLLNPFNPAQPLATPFNPAQPLATPFNPAQPFGNPFQACSTLWIALQPSRREATLFMHFHPSRAPSRALYLPSRGPFAPSSAFLPSPRPGLKPK